MVSSSLFGMPTVEARDRPSQRGAGGSPSHRRHPGYCWRSFVHAFQCGATPETIVQSYDTLSLADVYSVLAYCLTRREQIDEYMRRCDAEAIDVRRRVQATQRDQSGVRERLMRRAKGERIASGC